jgi:hypothetical protein
MGCSEKTGGQLSVVDGQENPDTDTDHWPQWFLQTTDRIIVTSIAKGQGNASAVADNSLRPMVFSGTI